MRDVVIAMGASTDSNVNRARLQGYDFAAIADYNLLEKTVSAARDAGKQVKVGNVFSADLFYTPVEGIMQTLKDMGVLAVEMEAAGLYGVAAEYGANALAVMTVSDHIMRGEALSADDRQNTFNDMIEITLKAVGNL
jgi:purine-nucleoside phosphorylase